MCNPKDDMRFPASLDGCAMASSIDLRDVPASEPIMPAFANAVRPPTVSSMERPNWLATMPDCDKA